MDIELDDAELVRQIGAGSNREVETELFRRMAPRIRLYGLRHLRDVHAADDLTQQVLITTLEALRAGRLREPDKLACHQGRRRWVRHPPGVNSCVTAHPSITFSSSGVGHSRLEPGSTTV